MCLKLCLFSCPAFLRVLQCEKYVDPPFTNFYVCQWNTKYFRLEAFFRHLKAHKWILCNKFFFFHSSLAIQMTNWVKKVQRFVILCIIMLDIPSEKTGLWRLPNVSCAFRSRLYQRTSSKQLYPSCRVTVKLCDVIKPLCPRFTKEFGNYHELWDPTLIVILMNIQHSRSPVYNVLRRCLILYKKKRRRNKASLTSAFVVILIYTTD